MEYQISFNYICLFILTLCTIGIYFLSNNQYTLLSQILTQLHRLNVKGFKSFSIINKRENNFTFESRSSDYYPLLPIHIYTQNLLLIRNRIQLILLGNAFFGSRNWGIVRPNQSSLEIMTSLGCPFLSDYCDITTDYKRFSQADAVVYHMRDGFDRKFAQEKRQPRQRFVFGLWEPPPHTPNLQSYREFFNWTMTYRLKSHVFRSAYFKNAYIHTSNPFYRLMLQENATKKLNLNIHKHDHRPSDEVLNKKKLGLAAALISNCGAPSKRLDFINKLKQYINVKIYGRCGQRCPPDRDCREFIAENYYFILSFENSLCIDYATEKFFAALEYPIVPVVLGLANYSYFIPSSGFININQFTQMKSLAEYSNKTRYDKEKYLSYFRWKKDYVWGLGNRFTSFCDLCVRLHLDTKPNIIKDIHKWWIDGACQRPHILP